MCFFLVFNNIFDVIVCFRSFYPEKTKISNWKENFLQIRKIRKYFTFAYLSELENKISRKNKRREYLLEKKSFFWYYLCHLVNLLIHSTKSLSRKKSWFCRNDISVKVYTIYISDMLCQEMSFEKGTLSLLN